MPGKRDSKEQIVYTLRQVEGAKGQRSLPDGDVAASVLHLQGTIHWAGIAGAGRTLGGMKSARGFLLPGQSIPGPFSAVRA